MEKEKKYLQINVTFILGISLSIEKIKKIIVYLLKLQKKCRKMYGEGKNIINVTFVLGISLSIDHLSS